MKSFFLFLGIFFLSFHLNAQSEFLNPSNSIAPAGGSFSSPNTPAPSVFKLNTTPSTPSSSTSILEEKSKIEFVNNNQFKNPGDEQRDKLNKGDGTDDSKVFRKNQYLGDYKTKSAYVKINYRDFGAVDGDVICVLVNDKVMVPRVFLEGGFKGLELGLEKGFNKIDFQALNEGFSAPNTAELRVFDDQGMLVSANQWNLATGFKATIIIVKE